MHGKGLEKTLVVFDNKEKSEGKKPTEKDGKTHIKIHKVKLLYR